MTETANNNRTLKKLHESIENFNGRRYLVGFSDNDAYILDIFKHDIITFTKELLPKHISIKNTKDHYGFSYHDTNYQCDTWAKNSEEIGLLKQGKISELGDFQYSAFISIATMYTILGSSAKKALAHPELSEKIAAAKEKVGFVKVPGFAAAR